VTIWNSNRKYDFADEVLAWRIKLRKAKYISTRWFLWCHFLGMDGHNWIMAWESTRRL